MDLPQRSRARLDRPQVTRRRVRHARPLIEAMIDAALAAGRRACARTSSRSRSSRSSQSRAWTTCSPRRTCARSRRVREILSAHQPDYGFLGEEGGLTAERTQRTCGSSIRSMARPIPHRTSAVRREYRHGERGKVDRRSHARADDGRDFLGRTRRAALSSTTSRSACPNGSEMIRRSGVGIPFAANPVTNSSAPRWSG